MTWTKDQIAREWLSLPAPAGGAQAAAACTRGLKGLATGGQYDYTGDEESECAYKCPRGHTELNAVRFQRGYQLRVLFGYVILELN